jgi:hypothetical protein
MAFIGLPITSRKLLPPLPCRKYDLERGVRDVVAHLISHHDLGAATDLDVVDDVLAVVRKELRQRLFGLVEVVVRVEHRIRKLAGRHIRLLEVSLPVGGNDITTSGPAKTPPL